MNTITDKEGNGRGYPSKLSRVARICIVISLVIQTQTTGEPGNLAVVGVLAAMYAALMMAEISILNRPRKKKKRSEPDQENQRAVRLSLEGMEGESLEDEYIRRRANAIRRYHEEIADIEQDYQRALVRQAEDDQESRAREF